MELVVRNVETALIELLNRAKYGGTTREETRNGPAQVFRTPVLLTYEKPLERVVHSPLRDANPFFHVMESIWMLAGRNDVAWVAQFNKGMEKYSDDKKVLNGAYGYRWRRHYKIDQLRELLYILSRNTDTRRAVLSMWDAADITNASVSLDVPCNTHAYFDLRGGALNMTVCNRSNDLIWGMCGANAVHFSYLLEYMAGMLEVDVGVYRQFTNNLHIYENVLPPAKYQAMIWSLEDSRRSHPSVPLITNLEKFDEDLTEFVSGPLPGRYHNSWFTDVALPIYNAWHDRKNALNILASCADAGWKVACQQWIERRAK